jgi:phosphate transporter
MKFSHSIQFNAVPDWSSHYISYSNLKKLIYQLEKQVNQLGQPASSALDPESSPLLASSRVDDPDKVFARKLDDELQNICSFYKLKESEIYGEVDALLQDIEDFQSDHDHAGEPGQRRQSLWDKARRQSIFRNTNFAPKRRKNSNQGSVGGSVIREEDESEDDDNEHTALNKSQSNVERRPSRAHDHSSGEHAPSEDFSMAEVRRRPSAAFADFGDDALQALYDEGITLKKRTTNLYVSICELRSFIQLNETGFSKVLKKYDKIVDRNLKSDYLKAKVKPAYPFQPTTLDRLQDYLQKIEEAYAGIVTKGDVEAARSELRLHLREHVVWERNTVWREMIGIERKAQAANLGIRNTMLGSESNSKNARRQGDQEEQGALKEVTLPIGKYRCPKFLLAGTFWVLMAIIAIFVVLLVVPIMEKPEQQNCLALVVFVSLLWATEVRVENMIRHNTTH